MNILKKILNKLPYVRGLYKQSKLYNDNAYFTPGHYYSTIIDVKEIKKHENQIWSGIDTENIKGVDLNTSVQLKLLEQISKYYSEIPFSEETKGDLRYQFNNPFYLHTDGILLYGMMRYAKPKHIIEVGSGYSSSLMLDVNDKFFNSTIKFTFIEPYPTRLNSLLRSNDKKAISILEKRVQDVDLKYFKTLDKDDILFIDSTHVSKCGSDVNYILFEILPILKQGVYIHFHDVFFPFEYPKEWVYKGYNWNEDYILRAFLMYNKDYEIQLFAHYLHTHHSEAYKDMPLTYKNTGGNLWLKKL
jgi:predicted O-methyltransferase YrrM